MSSKNFELLNSIKRKINIVNIIGNFLKLDKKGNNYWALCPFHKDDNPSLSVSEKKQLFNCFACNTKGDAFTFVQLYKHIPYSKAVVEVCELSGIDKSTISLLNKNNEYNAKYDYYYSINEYANNFFKLNLLNNESKKANEYLKKRHLDKETITFFSIGYALDKKNSLIKVLPSLDIDNKITIDALKEVGLVKNNNGDQDFFINRIMFPIHNHSGNIVGFSGRSLSAKSDVKYLNTEATDIFKKEEIFYNFFRVKDLVKNDSIYLCEGYMDVIALYRIGIKNAIALMGLNLSDFQIEELKEQKWLKKIYLCLDNDDAGINYSNKIAEKLLGKGFEIWFIKPYDKKYKDIDELVNNLGVEEVRKIISNQVDYFDFLTINALNKLGNKPQANDLVTISNDVLQKIKNYADPIVYDIHIKNLSIRLNLSETELKSKFDKLPNSYKKYSFENKELRLFKKTGNSKKYQKISPINFSTKIPISEFSNNNAENYKKLILIDELNLISKFYKFKKAFEDFKNISSLNLENPILKKIYLKMGSFYSTNEKMKYSDLEKIIDELEVVDDNNLKIIFELKNIINGLKMDKNVYDQKELIVILYRWMNNLLNKDFIVKVNDLTQKINLEKTSNKNYVKEYLKELNNKKQAVKQISLFFDKFFNKKS